MKLSIITYKQAKELKKLGLLSDEYNYLYLDGKLNTLEEYDEMDCGGPFSIELSESERLRAYSLELVAKWLRDKKKLYIDIGCPIKTNQWEFSLIDLASKNEYTPEILNNYGYSSYEKALSAGINECIKILKKNIKND